MALIMNEFADICTVLKTTYLAQICVTTTSCSEKNPSKKQKKNTHDTILQAVILVGRSCVASELITTNSALIFVLIHQRPGR